MGAEPIRSVGVAIARGAAERADRTEASGRSSRFGDRCLTP